jgi:hypothetical protein
VTWWWIADAVGLAVVIPLVVFLAHRLIRQTREIRRYAEDILDFGVRITEDLVPLPALGETQRLVATAKGNAVAYTSALRRLG